VPASVFAHLVKLEMIPVQSALSIIIRHLGLGTGKHSVAVTMMCKMLDINKTAVQREVQAGNTMQLEEIDALTVRILYPHRLLIRPNPALADSSTRRSPGHHHRQGKSPFAFHSYAL
jgi:hypothetical protein